MASKTRTPVCRAGAEDRGEEPEASPVTALVLPSPSPDHPAEQTVARDVAPAAASAEGDSAKLEVGPVLTTPESGMARRISGNGLGSSTAGHDSLEQASSLEASENEMLRSQLEQAWQLCNVLKSRMPRQEQRCPAQEPAQQQVLAPPSADEQRRNWRAVVQSPCLLNGSASPRAAPGAALPVRAAEASLAAPEPIAALRCCTAVYTPVDASSASRRQCTRSHSPEMGRRSMLLGSAAALHSATPGLQLSSSLLPVPAIVYARYH